MKTGLILGSDPFAHGAIALDKYVVDEAVSVPETLNAPTDYMWGMLQNDSVGDCFEAAVLHCDESFYLRRGVIASPWEDPAATKLYSAITGYDPAQTQSDGSNPTDQGTDPSQGMAWWVQHGAAGYTQRSRPGIHALAGFGQLPASSPNIRRSIWEFGGVIFCLGLPADWQTGVAPSGVPAWTGSNHGPQADGHAVVGYDFTPDLFKILTWGTLGTLDNAYAGAYLEQVLVPLSHEALNSADVGPAGFNFAQMKSDLSTLN